MQMSNVVNPRRSDQALRESTDGSRQLDFDFLHDDLGFQVHQTRRAVRKAMRNRIRIGGQPAPSGTITVLILIGLNPGAWQDEIAEALYLDSSRVASTLTSLQSEGLVRKRQSALDGRRQDLFLTTKGEELLAAIKERSGARSEKLHSGLTTRERERLVALLLKLQRSIRFEQ